MQCRFDVRRRERDSPLAPRCIIGRSNIDISSMEKMSVVGGRERLALLFFAGVKGGSGVQFQLNTSYMDEDILISAKTNRPTRLDVRIGAFFETLLRFFIFILGIGIVERLEVCIFSVI